MIELENETARKIVNQWKKEEEKKEEIKPTNDKEFEKIFRENLLLKRKLKAVQVDYQTLDACIEENEKLRKRVKELEERLKNAIVGELATLPGKKKQDWHNFSSEDLQREKERIVLEWKAVKALPLGEERIRRQEVLHTDIEEYLEHCKELSFTDDPDETDGRKGELENLVGESID